MPVLMQISRKTIVSDMIVPFLQDEANITGLKNACYAFAPMFLNSIYASD